MSLACSTPPPPASAPYPADDFSTPTSGDDSAVRSMFEKYDRNGSGAIEVEELRALLSDLGLLEGRSARDAASFVVQQFALADSPTKDSRLDYHEFAAFYSKVTAPRLMDAMQQSMPGELRQLKDVFLGFASFGAPRGLQQATELDGARFMKLCKESKLVGSHLPPTEVDIIFTKAKAKTARKLTFEQFLDALDMVAAKKGESVVDVVRKVIAAEGPTANNVTKGEYVKFHDDTSTYTGVYARGGPALDKPHDLAGQVSRHKGPVAESHMLSGGRARSSTPGDSGSGMGSARRPSTPASVGTKTPTMTTPTTTTPGRAPRPSTADGEADGGASEAAGASSSSMRGLKDTFKEFASFGVGSSPAGTNTKARVEMDSKQFMKLCRDSGLVGGKLTGTGVDLAFTKAKPRGARKIGYKEFLAAIEYLAAEKGAPKEDIMARMVSCSGPSMNGVVVPEAVRLYDDKSQYTGTSAH